MKTRSSASRSENTYAKITAKEPTDDINYIKEQSLDFCQQTKFKRSDDEVRRAYYSRALLMKYLKLLMIPLKLGSDNNFGYDYLADFEERFVPKHRLPVTTGWKEIDAICGGGLGKSELGVVIAPTGAGKSFCLGPPLGAQGLKEGKVVVHYTLELGDTIIATRYDSCLTGYPLSDIINFKDEVYEEIKDIEGKLIVKEYPTKSASTNTIKSHLTKLMKRGIKPGLIIVDYADLLRPVVSRKEKRERIGINLRRA